MPQSFLTDALWRSHRTAAPVPAVTMSVAEGFATLRELVQGRLRDGDQIAGWKIARLGGSPDPFLFAAPVFESSLAPVAWWPGLKCETEFVARMGADRRAGRDVRWHLGFEIIGNHDPGWCLEPAWAVADWGLHVAARLGPQCPAPQPGTPLPMRLTVDSVVSAEVASWKVSLQQVLDVLERDCAVVARPWAAGDLVWTGALAKPVPLDRGRTLDVRLDGYGAVTLPTALGGAGHD